MEISAEQNQSINHNKTWDLLTIVFTDESQTFATRSVIPGPVHIHLTTLFV
jgi:hypothetical protein